LRRGRKGFEKLNSNASHADHVEAGQDEYKAATDDYKVKAPLTLVTSRAELLRKAGRSPTQNKNLHQLKVTLARLTKRLVETLPRLLRVVETLPNGKLRLVINPVWFPSTHYIRLPWPPPQEGQVGLPLYLFLFSCRYDTKPDIALTNLYHRIGIKEPRPSHAKRRLLHEFAKINEHLDGVFIPYRTWPVTTHFEIAFNRDHVRFIDPAVVERLAAENARKEDEAEAEERRHELKELEDAEHHERAEEYYARQAKLNKQRNQRSKQGWLENGD
jgi:Skp family chaperone for outer membrane proteins